MYALETKIRANLRRDGAQLREQCPSLGTSILGEVYAITVVAPYNEVKGTGPEHDYREP